MHLSRHQEISCASGIATLSREVPHSQIDWHWHLQEVDRTRIHATNALFAGRLSRAHHLL
ncbi:hypothetical protein E1956_17835 [Paraburkholderia pallida]|uniref:Uncharacterized protein n=1 Tax=Paraburkholderia pallida TaxID=2547399 RepID=A0A4P7CWU2_9BURK|nr:hypothetical protein E1956_17835 [Paraburkholderia pallida]